MTNQDSQAMEAAEQKNPPFGARLQAAREALKLDRKEVAQRLRLNEKYIIMMEKDRYSPDLPVTFIRGYLRSYGKFLQLPEHEIKKAIEPIKPRPVPQDIEAMIKQAQASPKAVTMHESHHSNYMMHLFTSTIALAMFTMVGTWWYDHNKIKHYAANPAIVALDQQMILPKKQDITPIAGPVLAENNVTSPVSKPHTAATETKPVAKSTAKATDTDKEFSDVPNNE